mgnify:CR=1 FL=1
MLCANFKLLEIGFGILEYWGEKTREKQSLSVAARWSYYWLLLEIGFGILESGGENWREPIPVCGRQMGLLLVTIGDWVWDPGVWGRENWREPIPDVEILSLDSSNNAEISNTTKSPKSPDDELKRCLSLDTKTIWFDKSKCEDAEAKFQAKKSQEAKKSSTKV